MGVITLVVLAVAALAGRTRWFGRASAYVETVSYSPLYCALLVLFLVGVFLQVRGLRAPDGLAGR